ncbi:dynein regulatory complex subunit 5 [Callorhinchus milii]|uniref:T-complex-associated-testis-expressed 1 n=1 Tax=Callorhinchus milii TaxID=7868 RepID=A0A4W3K9C4_CALMI|nr:dynein regulatory complex subunit 5 [Callorhinchus milii]|eukprot:gi/632960799/ref/XP_007896404.1/ PREDICTED: T-complex-associated testis-expressed protein 1 [Callorhinchus milii]
MTSMSKTATEMDQHNLSPSSDPNKNAASDPRRMRRIIAEDPEWSLATVPTLVDLCLNHIITNFGSNPILKRLLKHHKERVLEKISTEIPIQVTANLVGDEGYWRRCCLECWEVCDMSKHGGSWKSMFFERLLKNIIEHFIPETTDQVVILELVPLCKNYVRRLEISQLLPPVKQLPEVEEDDISEVGSNSETSLDHFDFSMLLPKLLKLEELHVTYGVKDCGMNFEWSIFEFTNTDCRLLAKAIKACISLKVLKLTRNKIDDDKLRVLIKHMLDHPSLMELDLSHNKIGDRGTRAIAKLVLSSKLEKIDLCNNEIKAHGAKALSYKLRRYTTLRSLNLRLNQIGDDGGQAIGRALIKSPTLEEIHLGSNELTEPMAMVLSEVLAKNSVLKCIDLSCNSIGPDGGKQLQEGIAKNRTLLKFDLRLTEINQETEYFINQVLYNNQERVREDMCKQKLVKATNSSTTDAPYSI